MQSELFGANAEIAGSDRMTLQNPRLLKVRLDGELLARQGSMVAYQGDVEFAFEEGEGFVVIQASEGPVVPKHDHNSFSNWLT